ncbi:MAG TPA: carbohydrate ABC transporter permease [Thermomicrobiales bacterium]|nr:carbohydrate ABC transporter permease [Thermomicrobiales bacterium]
MDRLTVKQQERLGRIGGYAGLLLVTLIIGLPMFWMLSGSLKTLREIYTFPPDWIPKDPQWSNFKEAWQSVPFGRFYINSIIITFFGTSLQLICGILCAYAFAFLRFPFKNILFLGVLAALMVPGEVVILPNFIFFGNTIRDWLGTEDNWVNTYQAVVLPGAATAFGTFLMRQGFMTLPKDVLDAAKVDGAGHLRTMFGIVLPMAKPIVITFGMISLVNKWNDYLWPLVITRTDEMRPITVGVRLLFDAEGNNNWGVIMAGTCFVVIPLLIVYVFLQRYIIAGLTAGATKG